MKTAMVYLLNGEILKMSLDDNHTSLDQIVEEMRDEHDDVLKIDVQINIDKIKNDIGYETVRFLDQF